MKISPIIALLLSASPLLAGSIADIPLSDQVILNSPSAKWTPSSAEVKKGLGKIEAFLEHPVGLNKWMKDQPSKILGNSRGYRVQAWGIEKDGRKIIFYSFFPAPDPKSGDAFPEWRQLSVQVDDGGYDFWRIEYDPATGLCFAFETNGDA